MFGNSSTLSANYVHIPLLAIQFTNGTTQECMRSVCWDQYLELDSRRRCILEPRIVEGRIWNSSRRGDCPKDRSSFISIVWPSGMASGMSLGREPPMQYPGTCTFASEKCAEQVCIIVQETKFNKTSDNRFICMSDPAVAAAAVAGAYWFNVNGPRNPDVVKEAWPVDPSLPCKGEKPVCEGVTYLGSTGAYITSQAAPVHRPLVLLALASGLVSLLAACGITGA